MMQLTAHGWKTANKQQIVWEELQVKEDREAFFPGW